MISSLQQECPIYNYHNTCIMKEERQHSEKVRFRIELEPLCKSKESLIQKCSMELNQPFEDLTDYIGTLISNIFRNQRDFEIWAKKEQNVLLTKDNFTYCLNVFHHNGRRVDLLVREVNPELEKQKVQRYPTSLEEQGAVCDQGGEEPHPDYEQVIAIEKAPINLSPKLISQQKYREYCQTEQEQIVIFRFISTNQTRESFFDRREGEFDRTWLLRQLDLVNETSIPYQ